MVHREIPRHSFYIDTIDARAGLAFISRREPLDSDGVDLAQVPCYFVSPPSFSPVSVADRSLAMAASRCGFQIALSDVDGEIPFEALGDAVEFVRRAYIRGAGSDGAGGEGSGLPTPPDGEPGLGPPPAEGSESESPLSKVAQMLSDAAESFSSSHPERGVSRDLDWNLMGKTSAGTPHSNTSPARVWLSLLEEVVSRIPRGRPRGRLTFNNDAEAVRWRQAFIGVVGFGEAVGIFSYLSQDERRWLDDLSLQRLVGLFDYHLLDRREFRSEYGYGAIFVFVCWSIYDPVLPTQFMMRRFGRGILHEFMSDFAMFGSSLRRMDPWEELGSIPISRKIAREAFLPRPEQRSLAELLAAILSDPKLLTNPQMATLAALCAHRIVARDFRVSMKNGILAAQAMRRQPFGVALVQELSRNAKQWLAQNLPQKQFAPVIEELIRKSTDLNRSFLRESSVLM